MRKNKESYEALQLKCTLLETQNEILRQEVKDARQQVVAMGKAHEHFQSHISNPLNYKKWLLDLTNDKVA